MATRELSLRVRDLEVRYGKSPALTGLMLDVQDGEVVALLGANGAGKTTFLNTLSGFLKPEAGAIEFGGKRVDGLPPHKVTRAGIVQVSQTRDLWGDMTVLDNLELGAVTQRSAEVSRELEHVFGYFPRLQERRKQRVRTLSGGEQQMLAIGRALMARPKLMLLDEPSGGLAPRFVQEIGRIMSALKQEGATMLLVEQNIAMALNVADRVYVIRGGTIVHSASVAEFGSDHHAIAREFFL